jgi:hypothetical protein
MGDSAGARHEALFVVRIWREPSQDGSHWRASIEDVVSGRRLATADFAELGEFVAHRLASSAGDPVVPHVEFRRPAS